MSETVVFSTVRLIELCIAKCIIFSFHILSLVFYYVCIVYCMRGLIRRYPFVYTKGLLVDFRLDPQNACSSESQWDCMHMHLPNTVAL